MTPTEVVQFIATVRAAYPNLATPAGMPQMWHGLLGAFTLEDAELALTSYCSGPSYEFPPTAPALLAILRARRQAEAEKRVASALAVADGRRHGMPDWFREAYEASRAEHAGKYRERHEARREAQRAAGKTITTGFDPMPGWLGGGDA